MNQQYEQKLPVLLFLLQHHRFSQLIKAAFTSSLSKRLLLQYGDKDHCPSFTNKQLKKIDSDLKYFTLEQIIQLRGNHDKKNKDYKNPILTETLKQKYYLQNIDQYTRNKLWNHFTQVYQKPNFYSNLQYLQVCPTFSTIIQKDLHRTNAPPQTINKARQLLYSFSKYNPYIGYIQGMNDIAVFLLGEQKYGLNIEQSFFMLKYITQQVLPVDYYTNMKNIIAYLQIFFEMLHQTHSKIYLKIKELMTISQGHFLSMLSLMFQQFVCLFTRGKINKQIVKIIWDFIILQGIVALFKAGLVIFDYLEETVLGCQSFQQYDYSVECKVREITDVVYFKKRMSQICISHRIIEILKDTILQSLEKQEKKNLKVQKPAKGSVSKLCDQSLNYCNETIEKNSKSGHAYEVLVFKPVEEVNIISDYMEKLDKKYFHQQKSFNKTDHLMIGRMTHSCRPKSETITQSSLSQKTLKSNDKLGIYITPQKIIDEKNTNGSPQSEITAEFTGKKASEQQIRKMAAQKLNSYEKNEKGLKKSESTKFLQGMVQNGSLTNLIDYYQLDEMFQ